MDEAAMDEAAMDSSSHRLPLFSLIISAYEAFISMENFKKWQ